MKPLLLLWSLNNRSNRTFLYLCVSLLTQELEDIDLCGNSWIRSNHRFLVSPIHSIVQCTQAWGEGIFSITAVELPTNILIHLPCWEGSRKIADEGKFFDEEAAWLERAALCMRCHLLSLGSVCYIYQIFS